MKSLDTASLNQPIKILYFKHQGDMFNEWKILIIWNFVICSPMFPPFLEDNIYMKCHNNISERTDRQTDEVNFRADYNYT